MHWIVQVIHSMNFPYKDDGLWKPESTILHYHAYSYSILMFKVFCSSHMLLVMFCRFFRSGRPIPTAKTPTTDVLDYYSSARSRGYLADPQEIEQDRKEMAQKYGYQLPEVCERVKNLSELPKSTEQIFFGLQPGWIVNLADQEIIKPTDPKLVEFYNTETML